MRVQVTMWKFQEIVEYMNSKVVRVRFLDTGYETTGYMCNIRRGEVKDALYDKRKHEGTIYSSCSFGDFEIIEYFNTSKVKIRFINTGYTTYTCLGVIIRGTIKDKLKPTVYGVGYLGEGTCKAALDGGKTKTYSVWVNMLVRCYCTEYQEKYPCYKDCTVVEEWHSFQNFAKWYEENYVEGYHLDKDIKIEGNRIYGPDTCMLVSRQDNNEKAKAKHYKVVNPEGVVVSIYNMNKFCRDNNLTAKNLSKVYHGKRKHHKGWTKYEEENNNAKT